MTHTILRRKLAATEAIYRGNAITTIATVYGRGTFDIPALATAFQALREEHPVLAGRLEDGPDGPWLVLLDKPGPGTITVLEGDPDALIAGPAAALDPTVELIALRVVHGNGRFRLSLIIHHGVYDARGVVFMGWRLLAHYDAVLSGGEPLPLAPQQPPVPLETVFEERGVPRGPLSGLEKLLTLQPARLQPARPGPIRPVQVRLSADETTRLRGVAKARGVGLHGVIVGILLLTEYELSGSQSEIEVPVLTLVDVRDRIAPPLPPLDGSVMLGTAVGVVRVAADSDPFDLGAKIVEQLVADLDSGLAQQSHLHIPTLLTGIAQAQAQGTAPVPAHMVSLSNVGVIPTFPDLAGLVVEGVLGENGSLSSSTPGAADRPDPKQHNHGYMVSSYNGRMSFYFKARGVEDTVPDEEIPWVSALRKAIARVIGP
ncbi:MAG: phthiocerol/phthiodiolone dimycocerosyl transferase family protein [Segniliparus sp.]|uniref:phthiocerol/phthiodiolone dimycocerosyl transferase family protein n=1 Tax=Segniliparus sp. TaxID=2804064 RepID=UPI003F3C4F95